MKIIHKGLLALTAVVLYSALVTVALQVGGSSIGAIPLLLYSSIVGGAVMLAVAYFQDRGRGFLALLKDKKSLLILAITGVFAYAVSTLLFTWGTLGTTPSISAIAYRTYPLIIALLTPLALRQRVSGKQLLSLTLGLVGIGVLLSNGSLTAINYSELPFIALVLMAALSVAITTLVIKRYNASTTGFVILANAASVVFALAMVAAFHITLPINLTMPTILSILLIGGLDLGIGSALFYYSYKVFSTSTVGISTLAIPFLTIILSFALLGTQIKIYYLLAAALMGLSILLQEKGALRAPERVKSRRGARRAQIFDVTSAFIETRAEDVRAYVNGGGRALAIRLKGTREYEKELHEQIFKKRDCIAFTNTDPHQSVNEKEVEFINEIMGFKGGEPILIAMGNQENLEDSFEEYLDQKDQTSPINI